ncbi:MAG: IS3 family transposase [Nitrososphaerales archaeon]
MSVAIMLRKGLSLRKALAAIGSSQGSYYYRHKFVRENKGKLRDEDILSTIRELALKKPIYGTRMMAALLSKEIGRPVNRKLVQHAYEIMGWSMPRMTKKEILRAKDRVEKPTGINQLWQSDMTYIFCGVDGWCYLFNVIDVFSREWISYVFDTLAKKENAIQVIVRALEKHPEAAGIVILRCDNGPQYVSDAFQDSMKALRVNLEFIAYSTPEQNGHVESFHGRFKKEYVWTQELNSFQDADKAISEAFIDYNQRRPHSALGYLSPYEFLSRLGVKVN